MKSLVPKKSRNQPPGAATSMAPRPQVEKSDLTFDGPIEETWITPGASDGRSRQSLVTVSALA